MKKPNFGKVTLFGALLLLFAALPAVASADSGGKVKYEAGGVLFFSGPTQLLPFLAPPLVPVVGSVPATDTVSKFKYRGDGSIKEVKVTTTDELTVGIIGAAACSPNDDFCTDLLGSYAISLHDSKVKVKNITLLTPTTLPSEVDPLGSPVEVPSTDLALYLSGKIKGKLKSDFSLVKPGAGTMDGSAKLKIKGTATYVCVAALTDLLTATFLPISVCEAGGGKLVHPVLDVVDSGKFEIDSTSGVFDDIDKSKGKLTVAADFPGGDLTIAIKGKIERDDDDD